jgi:hypothetical protein
MEIGGTITARLPKATNFLQPDGDLKLQLLNFNYHRRAALMPGIAVVRGTTIAI